MPIITDNERHWFVAFTMSCREKVAGQALSNAGYEVYIPIVKEVHKWSDRKKIVDRLLIPHMLFVKCTELERRKTYDKIFVPGLRGFLNEIGEGPYHPAIIRDADMETFRALVENGGRDVTVTNEVLAPGDRVEITDGPLKGIKCELVKVGDSRCIAVRLGAVGTAKMILERWSVKKI